MKAYSFEMGPIRPPSEGQDCSLLIRATRNCPWNRCHFCRTYQGLKFGYRSVAEIKADIDVAHDLSQEIKAASWRSGLGGIVGNNTLGVMVRAHPEVYGQGAAEPAELEARLSSLVNVGRWLASGGRTAFLQDANTIIMRTPELVEVIKYLKEAFPTLERVTSYGRAKTAARKSPEEMKAIHEAGLSRLHVGLESGCDQVLERMEKGVTAAEHIAGGRRVVEAGISLSEYVMPGLGGRRWSREHALETARVLNEIGPDFIRLRSLIVRPGSPLFVEMEEGDFEPLGEDEVIDEIALFISNLSCRSYLASDQMSNLLGEIEGQLPQDKEDILAVIDRYRAMPLPERLGFRLKRRLGSHLAVFGQLEPGLKAMVEEALGSLKAEATDAEDKVDKTIVALKRGFI
ncbi:MAG: radical SAM protein [Chloroflexota bacterium]|nr:radical SAM protein [Chloroflexota bacterium]